MQSIGIVKGLDVFEHVAPRLVPGAVPPVMDELVLQAAEEALHASVVIAIPFPRHTRLNAVLSEQLLVGSRSVLTPLVGMIEQVSNRPGRRLSTAIPIASMTSCPSMRLAIDQPTTLRAYKSSTTARNRKPRAVGRKVMSPAHTRLGLVTAKRCLSRLATIVSR